MGYYDIRLTEDGNLAERSIELDSIELAAAIFGNCEIVTKEKGYFILKSVYRGLDK